MRHSILEPIGPPWIEYAFVTALLMIACLSGALWAFMQERESYLERMAAVVSENQHWRKELREELHDAREEALLSEEAWSRAVSDLSYCEFWEEHRYGDGGAQCLGPEYWTSYNTYTGP